MENKKTSLFTQMKPYIKGFQLPFVIAVAGAIISSIITVFGPYKLREITNLITEGLVGEMDLGAISNIGFFLALCCRFSYQLCAGLCYFGYDSALFKTLENCNCRENQPPATSLF